MIKVKGIKCGFKEGYKDGRGNCLLIFDSNFGWQAVPS